jgi:hypothetical protein
MAKLAWIILAILVALVGTGTSTLAFTSHSVQFEKRYKTRGTRLGTCMICHKGRSYKRNAYGSDYQRAGYVFRTIERYDSDGDGFSNLAEITAKTFPGDPNSTPKSIENPSLLLKGGGLLGSD